MLTDLHKKLNGVGLHFRRLTPEQQEDLERAIQRLASLLVCQEARAALDFGLHAQLDFCEWCSLADRLQRWEEDETG